MTVFISQPMQVGGAVARFVGGWSTVNLMQLRVASQAGAVLQNADPTIIGLLGLASCSVVASAEVEKACSRRKILVPLPRHCAAVKDRPPYA